MNIINLLLTHEMPCWIGSLGGPHYRCACVLAIETEGAETYVVFANGIHDARYPAPTTRKVSISQITYVAPSAQLDT